jgi:hypothetical protein
MYLVETEFGELDWTGLAQDRDKLRALANSLITFGFHKMLGNYREALQLVASRAEFSSTQSV